MEELFKSVRFGGFDKEEVLNFINNKLEEFEKKEEENQAIILDNKLEIETLKNKLLDYEEKLASTLVENQRLVDVITHQEAELHQEYTQSQIISTLVAAKNMSESIIQEAKDKSNHIINVAKSEAYQQIKFKTNSNETLIECEKKFKTLMKNLSALSEVSSMLLEKVNSVDKSLKDMIENLPLSISENE